MENPILDKSYSFALRIIKLNQYMNKEHNEYVLSKQVLRSGTSIGANVEEANAAQSPADFLAKMYISFKEARETHYWLRLLRDSGYLEPKLANSMINDCDELRKLLSSITKTTKDRNKKK